jgi:hypothetical protein
MCYMELLFGIYVVCVVYVVWTSSEVLKSDSDLTISLSVDVVHLESETPFNEKKKIETLVIYIFLFFDLFTL